MQGWLMSVTCPKCGYVRTATDPAPGWQCPSCGVAYLKVRLPESNAVATPALAHTPTADPPEPEAGSHRMLPFVLAGVLLVAIGVIATHRPLRKVPPTGAAATQESADRSIGSLDAAPVSAGTPRRLACGEKTYQLSGDKINDDIEAACEQAKQSVSAAQAYKAAAVRYACQASDGHIWESRTVPAYLLDDYTRNCQEYVAAEATIRSGTADRTQDRTAAFAAHRAATKKFTDKSNELALRGLADANELYQQKETSQAHLNKLIKSAGGSIEILE
jgi:hypothetical protein